MSSNNKEYFIIFDTNVLFQRYESKADFSSFSFNSTYDNVVNMINQLDIYESVNLVIPSVVWREMEKQIIEKHDERWSEIELLLIVRVHREPGNVCI
jgi:rRNA-processing protein FCF1